jgi:periplasmic protein TonB
MELKVEPFPQPQNLPERGFWIGLACVALLHASLVVGLNRSAPRQLGERDGSPDAISVDFVEPSALSARARPTQEPPAPAAVAAPPAAAAPRPAEAAQGGTTPAPTEAHAETPTPPSLADLKTASPPRQGSQALKESEAANAGAAPKEVAAAKEVATAKDSSTGPRFDPPNPPINPPASPGVAPPKAAVSPPGQTPAKLKPNPQLSLQLDLPTNFAAPSGLSTAAVRPPDITRSGENDEFGRRVIRALRQTMPPPRGELGRVTVRLLLSATGDLSELQLVRAAADAALTQSVVFAVKQSSFPIPPKGATLSDRTFLVTYIYN